MAIDKAGLGRFLRDSRKAKDLTQREVEAATGIAQTRLSQYEGGHVSPELGTLWELCLLYGKTLVEAAQALGVTPD